MGYQMKSYKKFIATAATATLVASAIVPVASASFSDVEETHEFATYINAAVDAGYIKGYADGTFGINDNLKRSQVVIIIGRYLEKLGYTSTATTSPWSDVTDEEVIKYGNIVKDAGVFTGYADGTLNGGGFITRENMAIVLDRLAETVKGTSLSDVAKDIEDVKITDLETANADYRDAIQALRDLGISTVENFNPKGDVTRGQFAKFIMNSVEKIEEIKVVEKFSVGAITKTSITINYKEVPETTPAIEDFTVTVAGEEVAVTKVSKEGTDGKTFVLTVDLNGKQGELVVNKVVADNAIDFAAPQIATVTPLADDLVRVTFDEAVTDATALLKGNYSIFATNDPSITVAVKSVKRVDEKTVDITTAPQTKDQNYTLYVKNVADANGNKSATPVSKTFVAIKDEVAPTIAQVVGLDSDKVEITFDEEVKTSPAFGVKLYSYNEEGKKVEITNAGTINQTVKGNKLTLQADNAIFAAGEKYHVELTAGTDLSGNEVKDSADFVGVVDKLAPTIVGDLTFLENGKVRVTFSEDVTITASSLKLFETKTGKALAAPTQVEAATDENGKAIANTFDITVVTLEASKSYSINFTGAVKDTSKAQNEIASVVKTFTTPAAKIETITLATSGQFEAGVDGKTFTVKFNRALTGEELEAAKTVAAYTITTGTGENVKTLEVKEVKTTDNTTFTLTTANQTDVDYNLVVSNIPNLSEDASKLTATAKGVDKFAPELVSVTGVTTNIIEFEFNEELAQSQTGAEVKAHLKSDITVSKTGTVKSVSGKKVTVVFEGSEALTAETDYTFIIKNIADDSANTLANKQVDFKTVAADKVAPKVVSSEVVDSNKVIVNFDEALTYKGDLKNVIELAKVKEDKTTEVVSLTDYTVEISSTNNKQLVITLNDPKLIADQAYKLTFKTTSADELTDFSDNAVKDVTIDLVGKADTVKPQLVSAVAAKDDELKLTFSEEVSVTLDSANANLKNIYVTKVSDGTRIEVTGAEVDATDKTSVKLTLASKTEYGTEYRVFFDNVAGEEVIKDTSAQTNILDANAAIATFTGVDTTQATATATLDSSTKVTLTFNEAMDKSSIQAGDFEVKVGGNTVAVSAAKVTEDGKKVELTIAKQATNAAVTVNVKEGQEIKDAHGVAIGKADAAVELVSATADQAAPELVSAKVVTGLTEDSVVVTFSEELADTTATTGISVDGYTVKSIAVSGTELTITLTGKLFEGDCPLVTFDETNDIKDKATSSANKFQSGVIVPK